MNVDNREKFRDLMAKLSILEPENKERQKLENEISHNNWAQEEWSILNTECQILREQLPNVPVPKNLEERLMAIPQKHPFLPKIYFRRFVAGAIAALVLLSFGLLAQLYFKPIDTQLNTMALMAVDLHLNTNKLIKTQSTKELKTKLDSEAPLKLKLPKRMGNNFQLIGGQNTTLDNKSVIFTRWKTKLGNCSLIQFKTRDFNLPLKLKWKTFTSPTGCNPDKSALCLMWAKNGNGFIWVVKNKQIIDLIRSKKK